MKKILKSNCFPFFILFLLMIFLHLFATNTMGDDVLFKEAIAHQNLFDFLSFRYQTWSSRVLIEGATVLLLQLPFIVWVLCNSAMYVVMAFSISKLFVTKNVYETNWLLVFLILLMPVHLWCETGWYATTMNYLWPLAFGIFAMLPIGKIRKGESLKKYEYLLYTLALIFACNQEQVAALVLAFYGLALLEALIKKKKNTKYLIFMMVLALGSLIFIMTTPGNAIRNVAEVEHWYPEFTNFNLIEKFFLGITATMSKLLLQPNLVFLFLSILLFYGIYKEYKQPIIRFIAAVPMIIVCAFSIFKSLIISIFPWFQRFLDVVSQERSFIINYHYSRETIMVLGLCFLVLGCLFYSLYLLWKDKLYLLFIPLGGLASRLILGFSPTIFASGMRTFLPFTISILITIILLWDLKKWSKEARCNCLLLVMTFSFFQVLNYLFLYF